MAEVTADQITKGLSQVARTTDGSGWALSKLDISGLEISSFGEKLSEFSHLRYLNASSNAIEDGAALASLPNLLAVDLSNNSLTVLPEATLENLQVAKLNGNKLKNPGFPSGAPSLVSLDVSANSLTSLEGGLQSSEQLSKLNLSGNTTLTSIQDIGSLPGLKKLDVSNCSLEGLGGLEGLTALENMNISGNASVVNFEGLGNGEAFANLGALDASGTGVAEIREVAKLNSLPLLQTLNLADSPVSGVDSYRIEVIIVLPKLKILDGEEITPEEREEATALIATREEERLAAEAAAEEEAE